MDGQSVCPAEISTMSSGWRAEFDADLWRREFGPAQLGLFRPRKRGEERLLLLNITNVTHSDFNINQVII